jgi:RND family efflux transporter MFP subunit
MSSKKFALPTVLIIVFALLFAFIKLNPASSQKGGQTKVTALSVETTTIKTQLFPIQLAAHGRVQASIQSRLVSQVAGQVVSVSEEFKEGGVFAKGDVLLSIDPRDYDVQVKITHASLASAKVTLEEEQNRAVQAKKEWASTQSQSAISAFALRKPQVAAATSAYDSAQAKYQQALVDRERTQIKAPFSGRLISQQINLGDVVNVHTPLASIYASDSLEVRMPINHSYLQFINLPNESDLTEPSAPLATLTITNPLTAQKEQWSGTLIRTAASVDELSQQLHLIAKIDHPIKMQSNKPHPLKVGQYVDVLLQGKQLDDVSVVNNDAIYQNHYVYIVENNTLQKRIVSVLWQNKSHSIISTGLAIEDELIITPLGKISSGTAVSIQSQITTEKQTTKRLETRKKHNDTEEEPAL